GGGGAPGGAGGARRRDRVVHVRGARDGHRGERLAGGRADRGRAARAALPPGAVHADQVLTHGLPPCCGKAHEPAQSRPRTSRVSGSIRNSGPETDSAATHVPAGSNTGAATATRPSSSSAAAVA